MKKKIVLLIIVLVIGILAGCSGPSPTKSIPAAPSNLSAQPLSSTSVRLNWNDNSTNELGFRVERSISASTGFTSIGVTGANEKSFSDNSLTPETTYYYRVKATNAQGDSPSSNSVMVTTGSASIGAPAAPTDLIAAAVSSEIKLSWSDNSDNETGFKIYCSLSALEGYSLIRTVSANLTSYSDMGLTPGTYYYRVEAYNEKGASFSNTEEVTITYSGETTLNPPSSLFVQPLSSSSLRVSWQDNSDEEDGFRLYRSTSEASGFTQIDTIAAGILYFNDNGLSSNTTYYYRIQAFNSSMESLFSSTASGKTLVYNSSAPAAPSNLQAQASSAFEINLSWQDNSDNELAFKIFRSLSPGSGFSEVGEVSFDITRFTDNNLTPDTTYYYHVIAYNSKGGAASAMTEVTTEDGAAAVPTAPTNLEATAVSETMIYLTWTDNSSDETGFRIYFKQATDSQYQYINASVNTTGYQHSGLHYDTTYEYYVVAYNGMGISVSSGTTQATTFKLEPPDPTAPGNLTAQAISSSQITLTWSDADIEHGYFIYRSLYSSRGFTQVGYTPEDTTSFTDNNLNPDTNYYYQIKAYTSFGGASWSSITSSTTQSINNIATLRVNNNTRYCVLSLMINGQEMINSYYDILSDYFIEYEFNLPNSPAVCSYEAVIGAFNPYNPYDIFPMYTYWGDITLYSGQTAEITLNLTLADVLTEFADHAYFDAMYWYEGQYGALPGERTIVFYNDGTWEIYDSIDNYTTVQDRGNLILDQWNDYSLTIYFKLKPEDGPITLIAPFAEFLYDGPSWSITNGGSINYGRRM